MIDVLLAFVVALLIVVLYGVKVMRERYRDLFVRCEFAPTFAMREHLRSRGPHPHPFDFSDNLERAFAKARQ